MKMSTSTSRSWIVGVLIHVTFKPIYTSEHNHARICFGWYVKYLALAVRVFVSLLRENREKVRLVISRNQPISKWFS